MNSKIDATVINDRGGIFELAMVVDGKMIVFDLERHVAAGLASKIAETLAKPYFVATVTTLAALDQQRRSASKTPFRGTPAGPK